MHQMCTQVCSQQAPSPQQQAHLQIWELTGCQQTSQTAQRTCRSVSSQTASGTSVRSHSLRSRRPVLAASPIRTRTIALGSGAATLAAWTELRCDDLRAGPWAAARAGAEPVALRDWWHCSLEATAATWASPARTCLCWLLRHCCLWVSAWAPQGLILWLSWCLCPRLRVTLVWLPQGPCS